MGWKIACVISLCFSVLQTPVPQESPRQSPIPSLHRDVWPPAPTLLPRSDLSPQYRRDCAEADQVIPPGLAPAASELLPRFVQQSWASFVSCLNPSHAQSIQNIISLYCSYLQALTLRLSCCRKPERGTSVGWRQLAAGVC